MKERGNSWVLVLLIHELNYKISALAWYAKHYAVAYLNKQRDGVESSDNNSVVHISGQDVERASAALYDLLHSNTLL